MKKPAHPGKTAAQRRVLDQIGCGDFTPSMSKATREAMLRDGLIIEAGMRTLGRDSFGRIQVMEYAMPIPVHMTWCRAMADDAEVMREMAEELDEPIITAVQRKK